MEVPKVAAAFECFHVSVCTCKRLVYQAVVLPALLYGAETWAVKAV